MKTTIRNYKRDNKKITLIGVMHIGTTNYYKNIQKELDNTKHNKVLYEGVIGYNKSDFLIKLYNALSDVLGLVFQKKEIKYNKSWIRSDLNIETLISASKKLDFNDIENDCDDDFLEELKKFKGSFIFRLIFKTILNTSVILSFFFRDPVILDLRNYKVILDCINQLKDNDNICIFYGEAHLKGISSFIKKIGFKEFKRTKLNPFM